MMRYRYLILDGDADSAESLKEQLSLLKRNFEMVGTTGEIEQAIALIDEVEPDLVFSDIKLRDGTFFDILPKITRKKFKTIFITRSKQYLLSALRFNAIDYINKPFESKELLTAVRRFERRTQRDELVNNTNRGTLHGLEHLNKIGRISIAINKGYMMKTIDKLIFVRSANNYSEFCFGESEKYMVAKTLLECEALLERHGFLRIHQSYLINLAYMSFFDSEGMTVYLDTGVVLPVALRRKATLIDYMKGVL